MLRFVFERRTILLLLYHIIELENKTFGSTLQLASKNLNQCEMCVCEGVGR